MDECQGGEKLEAEDGKEDEERKGGGGIRRMIRYLNKRRRGWKKEEKKLMRIRNKIRIVSKISAMNDVEIDCLHKKINNESYN